MTGHENEDRNRYSTKERCRGVLEMAILVGIIVWTIASPSLLMLPVLAAAGGLLVVLAIWEDACRLASDTAPDARPRADAVLDAVRDGNATEISMELRRNPDGIELCIGNDGMDGISQPCARRMMKHRARVIAAT